MGKLMAMVYIPGSMVIGIKGNLKIVLRMGKEYRNLVMEIYIKGIILEGNLMGLGSITGIMVVILKGCSN